MAICRSSQGWRCVHWEHLFWSGNLQAKDTLKWRSFEFLSMMSKMPKGFSAGITRYLCFVNTDITWSEEINMVSWRTEQAYPWRQGLSDWLAILYCRVERKKWEVAIFFKKLNFILFFILRLLYFKQSKTFHVHLKFIVFCLHAAYFFLGECSPNAVGDLTLALALAFRELVI